MSVLISSICDAGFHPEIELNLCFRDYLRAHPNKRDDYARLKEELIQDESSLTKQENSLFTHYTLLKVILLGKF
jgi:GrpB-like predicted nucleotidyltransferase (UPF0157 family)